MSLTITTIWHNYSFRVCLHVFVHGTAAGLLDGVADTQTSQQTHVNVNVHVRTQLSIPSLDSARFCERREETGELTTRHLRKKEETVTNCQNPHRLWRAKVIFCGTTFLTYCAAPQLYRFWGLQIYQKIHSQNFSKRLASSGISLIHLGLNSIGYWKLYWIFDWLFYWVLQYCGTPCKTQ